MNEELRNASKSLNEKLKDHFWFTAVGISCIEGKDSLTIYAKRKSRALAFVEKVGGTWEGYPLLVKRMDLPKTF